MENLTHVEHPLDVGYQMKRRSVIKSLLKLSPQELDEKLRWDMTQAVSNKSADGQMSQKALGDMMTAPYIPQTLKAGILDSTSGTTGNVL